MTKKPSKESPPQNAPANALDATPEVATPETDADDFPIVGIGASAGGLEALEQFLENVPQQSGMAFVIIQHLDPTHKGMMPELLQRSTEMQVVQATNRMPVKPDYVYVIPPNKYMSILHGELHLLDPMAPRGLRLPIDHFFRSLADDRQEKSIGVILSGMGSDGTRGLAAIKEEAGVGFVQAPDSARCDGMPRSAINANLADIVAPAQELPAKIMTYLQRAPHIAGRRITLDTEAQTGLEKIVILLRSRAGCDFSVYRNSTLQRRVERRMGIHQIDGISGYVRYLQENPQELDLLFKELLIGVTRFFRDPPAWEYLKTQVLPAVLASRPQGGALRAWVAGCSTGEEAYSLGIVFREVMEDLRPRPHFSLQIFATDLDPDAIDKARQGVFPSSISADVTPDRLNRFFAMEDSNYRIHKDIREMIVFARQNVLTDPPFSKIDILTCRNLLIYLKSETQRKILSIFHNSLNPGGILLLGNSETIGAASQIFEPLDARLKTYRRLETAQTMEHFVFPFTFTPVPVDSMPKAITDNGSVNLQPLVDGLLLQRYCPTGVLVNSAGDILYISGRTGKYLEPATGKVNWNVLAMAREGLRHELIGALQSVTHRNEPITIRNIMVKTNGDIQPIDLTAEVIQEPPSLRGLVMLIFQEVPKSAEPAEMTMQPDAALQVTELEQRLKHAQEVIQITREEAQSSQEELMSGMEELQSTNEELQSTNEELTTSREEMQSMNEELLTVNAELQASVDELNSVSDDMANLLNSTELATIFLDEHLRVLRFTPEATHIVKLIPGDVGRPLADLVTDLRYPEMLDDAGEVLRTLTSSEKQVVTTDGRWFSVRIIPYRTRENKIAGLVLTFTNITVTKQLELGMRQSEARYRNLFETMTQGIIYRGADRQITAVNPAASRILNLTKDQILDRAAWWIVREDGSPFADDEHPETVVHRTGKPLHGLVLQVRYANSDARRWIVADIDPEPLDAGGEFTLVRTTFSELLDHDRHEDWSTGPPAAETEARR